MAVIYENNVFMKQSTGWYCSIVLLSKKCVKIYLKNSSISWYEYSL